MLDRDGVSESLTGEMVSGNCFDILGVRMPLGRSFTADGDRAGSPVRVVVISHALWQTRLGGDPAIIGRTISLNGNAYTVVGVAPSGFTGPMVGRAADAWVPSPLQPEMRPPSAGVRRSLGHSSLLGERGLRWLNDRPVAGRITSRRRPPAQTSSHAGLPMRTRVPIGIGASPLSRSARDRASACRRGRCCAC